MSSETIITLLSIAVPALAAILGSIIARQTMKIRIMREQLSGRKHDAYAKVIDMFYSMLKDTKANRTTDFKRQMSNMVDAKRDIFMYGSDKVFLSFNNWLVHANDSDSKVQFEYFLKFVLEIRKDLCGNATKLTEKDILMNLTQSEEETNRLFK